VWWYTLGGFLKEGGAVDVEGRLGESKLGIPVVSSSITRDEVKRLHRVVEVGKINFCIGVGCELILCLGDEKFVLIICEELTFIGVEINVITPNLGSIGRSVTISALNPNLYIVVLKTH
jgi:hypothetical protein